MSTKLIIASERQRKRSRRVARDRAEQATRSASRCDPTLVRNEVARPRFYRSVSDSVGSESDRSYGGASLLPSVLDYGSSPSRSDPAARTSPDGREISRFPFKVLAHVPGSSDMPAVATLVRSPSAHLSQLKTRAPEIRGSMAGFAFPLSKGSVRPRRSSRKTYAKHPTRQAQHTACHPPVKLSVAEKPIERRLPLESNGGNAFPPLRARVPEHPLLRGWPPATPPVPGPHEDVLHLTVELAGVVNPNEAYRLTIPVWEGSFPIGYKKLLVFLGRNRP